MTSVAEKSYTSYPVKLFSWHNGERWWQVQLRYCHAAAKSPSGCCVVQFQIGFVGDGCGPVASANVPLRFGQCAEE
jgi:hypothetical protein